MPDWLASLADPRFMPHGHCYLWQPEILWLHVGSDALIAASYFSIPAALVTLVRRREDLAFDWIFLLFGAFIFWCGVTHVFGVWTTWSPVYRLEGSVKLVTALVSATTAVLVWPLIPRALRLPSAAELQQANERYQKLNEELETRVRERTEELEQRNADLQSFSAFLSHELRQPLQTIRLGLPLLMEAGAEASPAARQTLERMQRAARSMAEQVEAQLALARVFEAEFGAEPVSLGDLVRESVDELRPELAAAGAEARVEAGIPDVQGDARSLRQLLRNLLENALKYRRADVPLQIRIAGEPHPERPSFVRLRVEDNGRGFAPADAERIFSRFERVGDPGAVPGTGLGLTLCRRIAQRHGGTIHAAGRPGAGATFVLELPSALPPGDR